MKTKTGWYNHEELPKAMLNAVEGRIAGWKQLEDSDHFFSLKNSFVCCSGGNTLLDLGCGAAEVSRVFKNFDYTGADLPHIIEKVSKKRNPDKNYVFFDANSDNYSFLKIYDIILMNSFLSEIPDYFKVLNNILFYSKKYIIIHRQLFEEDGDSRIEDYYSYANIKTTKTIINYKEFLNLCEKNDFEVISNQNSDNNSKNLKTIVLKKI